MVHVAGNPLPAICHKVIRQSELGPGRLIVVGDVHGCLNEFFQLLDTLDFKYGYDNLLLTGDLVNKGPRSQEVVAALRALSESGQVWAVRGNNDDVALSAWYQLQAGVPLESLKKKARWVGQLQPEDVDYLNQLPFSIRVEGYNLVVVHAGMLPGTPLQQQQLATLTTMRDIAQAPDGSLIALERATESSTPWAGYWQGILSAPDMATYPAHYNSRRNKAIRQFLGFTDRNTRVTREYALQRGFPTVKALKDHAHGLLQGFPEDLWLDAHRRGEFDETPQRIRNDAARRTRLQQQAATPASKRLWPRRTDLVVHGRRSLPDGSLVPRLRKQVQASGTVKLKLSWKQQKAGAVARTSTQEVPFVVIGQLSKIKRLAQEYAKQLQQNELSQSPVISVDIDAVDIASVHVMQTNARADLADVRMTNIKHYQLDRVPMTYYDRGQGTCVFDAVKYLYTKQYPKCGLQTYFKDEVNFWSDIKAANFKRTGESCYDPAKQGVSTLDLYEGFCKPHGISMYGCEANGECFFFNQQPSAERYSKRPPLCYRVMGNHCYPDLALAKSLSQVRETYHLNRSLAPSSFKAGNTKRGDDRLSRIAAGKLVHVEDVSGLDHLRQLMQKTGTVPDGKRVSVYNNKIVSYELGGVTYVFGEQMDLVRDTYKAIGKEWDGQTFGALLWDLVEEVYGDNGLPKGRPNPEVSGDNEFDAAAFRAFNESKGITLINHVSKYVHNPGVQGGNSLGVIDSFARSIKHMVRTYALSHNNPRWGEYLQDVLGVYNETPHAGLKMMTPDWVFLHPDSMWHDMVAKVELNKRVNAALEASDYHTEDEVRAIMGTRRVHKVKLAGKLALGDMVMVLKDKASQFAKGPRRNLDRIFVVAELMPRLRYRVAEYADLLAKGLSPASDDWIAQVDLLDRVYARPELYKLSPEDLPEDGADLGLSVEEYQQAREHLREQLEEEGDLDDPEDRDFVAVKEEPDDEEIDEARGEPRIKEHERDEVLSEDGIRDQGEGDEVLSEDQSGIGG
ncbi:hypothetical protein OEZ85_014206 [Tetradesmus obliquus]|uniref:Calcineurin-like phosphoesterase domain-containing protein n=1 Tax=Tetradesmus obliquus TaxID=3088 RepID=A0ABY8UCE3_TETOB|nr:hypothetical protein OEZ85_014206 [Tetradesmus obliquus]